MSFVTFVIGFVALLFFALTYVISTTVYVPVFLAGVTFMLGMLLCGLAFMSWMGDRSDKLEDFTDGR